MLTFYKTSFFIFKSRNKYFTTVKRITKCYPKIVFAKTRSLLRFLSEHFPYLLGIEVIFENLFKNSVSTAFSDGIYKNSISENGFYPAGSLKKTIVKNENWKANNGKNNTTEEFKDTKGNIVLKRNYNNGEAHDTYYVYNRLDLLAFVIPPMANANVLGDHLDKWCYQYHYDAKKRIVEKKLPQKEWEYIVYDKADRVVMTGPVYNPFGDGSKGWLITKYDLFGRSIYTGYYAAGTFSSAERNSLVQNNFTIESKSGSNTTIDGITTRYTNTSFPTSFKLLSINYYDNYSYPGAPTSFSAVEGKTVNTALKGQLTGSWIRILTTPKSTAGNLAYTLYDDKYRAIRSYSQNHLGGYTQVDNLLNFTGTPAKTVTYQKQNGTAAVLTVTDVFTYDRRDRLTKQTQQIGTGTVETIVSNTYDELGVLITKNVGGTIGNLQTVGYKYNIRGWLTDINNASPTNDIGNDLFQLKINYDQEVSGWGVYTTPLYNGNISSIYSRTKVNNFIRGYEYKYDQMNRLVEGNVIYYASGGWRIGWNSNNSYNERPSYDKNGNILTMERTGEFIDGQPVKIDEITYTYNGNQLQTVTDATNNTDGFKDGNKTGDDYFYDTLGNITQDKNKGITAVSYNHLNLPYQVSFANGGTIKYTYDAAGTRLSKKVQPSGGALVTTDYVDGFQYENNSLKFFHQPEGFVEYKNNQYIYNYIYKDHLGNNRLVYADLNKDGVINPANEIIEENNYYPFGLKQKGYNELATENPSGYKYKFGGKELNDELGLDLYDFGARNYDAAIGRWLNIDPLAENSRRWTPYNYAYNNPIYFVDPDGMQSWGFDSYGRDLVSVGAVASWYTGSAEAYWSLFIDEDYVDPRADGVETDYKKNKDGSLTVVENENINNETDRIVRLDKKGDVKEVLIPKIAKGILKDGINFKERNNVISVNGTNQPTETDFQDFISAYSHLVRVEVSGYALGEKISNDQISAYLVEAHKGNGFDSSASRRFNENTIIPRAYLKGYFGKSIYAKYHYHTHPDNSLSNRFDEGNAGLKNIPHYIFNQKYNQQYNENGVIKTTPR